MTMVGVGRGRGRGDAGLPWTDERCLALRKLRIDGLSASQIAAQLGGITRSAVIGKIHRLGLSNREASAPSAAVAGPKPPRMAHTFNVRRASELAKPARITKQQPARLKIRPGHASQRAQQVQPIEATEIVDLAPDTSEFACTIAGLGADMCRYPLGDVSADMQYCGAPCTGSWCPKHRRIVFTKAERPA